MNRKIFLALCLMAVMLASVSSAAADENVTIDGIDFAVPGGFTEDPAQETVNEQHSKSGVEFVTNGKLFEKGDTIVALLVADYKDFKVTDDIIASVGADAKTVNGVDGYIRQDGHYYVFSYEKDGKLVSISANDEDAIADFLIA